MIRQMFLDQLLLRDQLVYSVHALPQMEKHRHRQSSKPPQRTQHTLSLSVKNLTRAQR